jgi:hypothetical protein
MFVYHFMVQELFGGKKYQDLDVDEVSETLTDIWLRGIMAGEEDASSPKDVRESASGNGSGRGHGKSRNRTAGRSNSALGNGHK